MRDDAFAIEDRDGYYFIGNKQWDKQLIKAKLYHSYKYAKDICDDIRFIERDTFKVAVRIVELHKVNCEDI